jgi:hypothetical protein
MYRPKFCTNMIQNPISTSQIMFKNKGGGGTNRKQVTSYSVLNIFMIISFRLLLTTRLQIFCPGSFNNLHSFHEHVKTNCSMEQSHL